MTDAEAMVARVKAKMVAQNYRFTAIGNTFPHREIFKAAGFRWDTRFSRWQTEGPLKPSDDIIQRIYKLPGVQLTYEVL